MLKTQFLKRNYIYNKLVLIMRKNFDMDAAIRRALRESIEAHAHEWEPDFKTGVGPVGDDAPFDEKVNEECGKEEACCPKCGKCPCECEKEEKVNEGTIPGDSHEWEPDFSTGVGEVGDDNPFTQAVNEAFVEGGDWEKDSFGASDHKKEGISFADGGDECQNGVVATSQKNSGEVVSSDNLSESEDEEGKDEGFLRNVWQGAKAAVKPAVDRFRNAYKDGKAQDQAMKDARAYAGNRDNYEKNAEGKWQLKQQNTPSAQASPAASEAPAAQNAPSAPEAPQAQQPKQAGKENAQAPQAAQQAQQGGMSDSISKADLQQWMQNHAGETDKNGAWENLWQFVTGKAQLQESKEKEKDVIAEERDRFFNIINRIEKLYD